MKAYPTEQIRTVVCVGPPGAGKTSLVEAILFRAGSLPHKGRIEDGTTVSDHTPEEINHGYSIDASTIATEYENVKINLIDTPGSSEFFATTALAMEAADAALVVIDAQTVTNPELLLLWNLLNTRQLPRLVFINKCDRDPEAFAKTVSLLHETLGQHIDPIELPLPEGNGLGGVIDLIANRGFLEHGTTESEIVIPADLVEQERTARDTLLDEIVQEDDAIMERYLSGEELPTDELARALSASVRALHLTPLLCGSATGDVGMHHLVDALINLVPPPTLHPHPGWSVLVVSATQDQYLGRLSVLKNLGAALHPDDVLTSADGHEERLHQLLVPTPSELRQVPAIDPGDLVVVPKLAAPVGTLLTRGVQPSDQPTLHPAPVPGFTVAITTEAPQDEERLAANLFKVAGDDPGIKIDREPGTHRLLVQGFGTNHLAITVERIQRRGQFKVQTHEPITQYRETFRAPAQAEGRYKKQTGGHGQFGVATIIVEPLSRDSGFEFVDEIVGGAIPRNFIPAVEKGILEAMEAGGLVGYPITDIRVRLIDGKYHSVDSSEMSFKMAGSLALREALNQAQSQLLEPITRLLVTAPVSHQGDVLGYLSSKRGKILHTTTPDSAWVSIEADVPAAELISFAPDLRAMTNGLGSFVGQPHHYDAVPDHIATKLTVSAT
ncbi:elongation factor G [Ferrimicrobium sp.]|uniref:elongation factor G n=1 Tax=Ferrimicrobium sp. TaxID=2926050 RepID=UPI00261C3BEA|nr:elongation factor G [Ferrimicrobium sp.]